MVELVKLHIGVVLKHVLDLEPLLVDHWSSEEEDEASDEDDDELDGQPGEDGIAFEGIANGLGKFGSNLDAESLKNANSKTIANGKSSRPQTAASSVSSIKLGSSQPQRQDSKRKKRLEEKHKKRKRKHQSRGRDAYGADLLDFDGPELIHGVKNMLFFHNFIGQLNWIGWPLLVSIAYKLLVIGVTLYALVYRLATRFMSLNVLNENPIFVLISCLAAVNCLSQVIVNIKTNLFDLSPMYKILTTPKLCFIKVEVQHLLGTKSLGVVLVFLVYHGLLIFMLMFENLEDFVNGFYLPYFIVGVFVSATSIFYLIGMALIDLYIRSAFGHWLLALKSHLENRFMHFHRRQKKIRRQQQLAQLHFQRDSTTSELMDLNQKQQLQQICGNSAQTTITTTGDTISYASGKSQDQRFNFITLDEIQRHLNNMDDHLEVLRSVQINSLVHISLTAFLANGAIFLIAYNLLANQSDFYHGFILLLISVNTILIIFMCYSGDRWVYYALSSFVQTVEDEYFMQNDMKSPVGQALEAPGNIRRESSSASLFNPDMDLSQQAAYQALLIKKKDVLFCREFLHQFENHLATPWSKLTVKTHLHMIRTFVTLIAAQIIFDHEH